MKNKILICLGLLILPFFNSCEEEVLEVKQPIEYEAPVAETFDLNFVASDDSEAAYFQYNVDLKTGNAFWAITDIAFDVSIVSNGYTYRDISKVELYLFAEKRSGDTYNYIGGNQGVLISTVNNPEGPFKVELSKDDMDSFFNGISAEDIFEMKWVITGNDDSVKDTRTNCSGFNCSFGFGTKINYVDTWVGEFQYNWIDVGADSCRYSYAKVCDNPTGTVLFSVSETEDVYNVNDLSFGGSYGAPRPGTIEYDSSTKTLTVTDPSFWANKWELISQTDEVLTIKWTYYYSQWYTEYGTLELSRNDGLSWPANLIVVNN